MPSPRYWREIPARYRLQASRCPSCNEIAYPSRDTCPSCRKNSCEKIQLSPRGKVITSTIVHVPPADFVMEAPYAMALVETPEGTRLMVQIADCDPKEVKPGMEVELEFRRIRKEGHGGILCYGYKGVPAGR